MFGEKSQAVAKRFEPLKSVLDFGNYITGGLALVGITGAAMIAWFTDSLTWVWNAFGVGGAVFATLLLFVLLQITVRLSRGMFHSWRGAVGLVLIAVGLIGLVSGALILARDKFPQKGEQVSDQSQNAEQSPRSVFEAFRGGKIDASNMTINGTLPPGFVKTDTGGQFVGNGGTVNVVHTPPSLAFPPADGTFHTTSPSELSSRLNVVAKELRERTTQPEWIASALKGRSLSSEALERLKTLEGAGPGGIMIQMIYIPDRAAANEAANFLNALSAAVAKK
jgi:hypothetical protein